MGASRIYENVSTNALRKLRFGEVQVGRINRKVQQPYGIDYYYAKSIGADSRYITSRAYQMLNDAWSISNRFAPLAARCYDSLYRQASGGKRAAAAITMVEWQSSFTMIASAARSIAASAHALRRGDVLRAVRELNIRSHHSSASRAQRKWDNGARLDRLWLELNFGWGPLIDDIRQMCAVLAQEVPTERIRSSATGPLEFSDSSKGAGWSYSDNGYGVMKLRYTSVVQSVNPNVLLAKQLGLTNPAQVIWDAVPMSFVVDWFLPVNKYLSSFDASLGVTLGPVVQSKSCQTTGSYRFDDDVSIPPRYISTQSEAYQFRRTISAMPPMPSFSDRLVMPSGSLWQAATTVALAAQQLIGIRANSRVAK